MYSWMLFLQLILCFILMVNTDHTDDNLCVDVIRTTRYYQDYQRTRTPCVDEREIFVIPTCYYFGYKDIYPLRIFRRREYNLEWKCCAGFSRQSSGEQCTPIVQGCRERFYRTGDICSSCDCNWENTYLGCAENTGECFCKPGYNGSRCDSECPDGYFGEDCKFECSCKDNSTCNKTNGQCPCSMPGWTGMRCTEACSDNRYGMLCSKACDCSPSQNRFCDPEEGCICNPGYTGDTCDEMCPNANWTYGPTCREKCLCQRLGTERCDPESGACECKPGWDGHFCTDLCSNNTYGHSCNETCQCDVFEVCLPTNGSCVCPMGFTGERCEKSSNDTRSMMLGSGHSFPLAAAIISLIVLALILVAVSIGIFILARRSRNSKQLNRNESNQTQPLADHYSTIANDPGNVHVNDHYNSILEPPPDQNSTQQNSKPYDKMKMASGMYDSLHDRQVTMVIGEEYDNVRMSNPKTSTQYDHMPSKADRENRGVFNSEYDKCVLVNAEQ